MEGHASISSEVLARYAADAAREVEGVRGLVESHLPRHRGVRIGGEPGVLTVELHLEVAWGASIPAVGEAVQERVREYLERMAGARPQAVDVVVDEIGAPS
ncbi:MAG: Asp23/Gls24 family envelope stress response protein [Actinomycetota bacterium]|nr:Asp23/Gls24 family envelope stress response protein [Actinomycetota bacterium]